MSINISRRAIIVAAAMEELDADDKRLSFQGRYADRDIVQVHLFLIIFSCLNIN